MLITNSHKHSFILKLKVDSAKAKLGSIFLVDVLWKTVVNIKLTLLSAVSPIIRCNSGVCDYLNNSLVNRMHYFVLIQPV